MQGLLNLLYLCSEEDALTLTLITRLDYIHRSRGALVSCLLAVISHIVLQLVQLLRHVPTLRRELEVCRVEVFHLLEELS